MILTPLSNQSHPVLAREENLIQERSSESYPATDTEKKNKPEFIHEIRNSGRILEISM